MLEDLKGKIALVTGIANKRSISFAVAQGLKAQGVRLALTYLPLDKDGAADKFKTLTEALAPELVMPLDVADEASMAAVFQQIQKTMGGLQVFIHSIASAKRGELDGKFSDITQDGYLYAHQISSYSLISLVRHAKPLLQASGGSVVTLSYIGAERAVKNYNVMGSAKAALEANVRYLAMEMGPDNIRVNAVSAGPIRTLSSAGVKDFLNLMHNAKEHSPLQRDLEPAEVANMVTFLSSNAASGVTGQTIYVDCGYNIHG
ncbi:MAG: SDR family oxidoreductase [Deltaproteobacteria bacterium]|nr:SDR family oxidoreductase [Deltaproteobacteria bacterium]